MSELCCNYTNHTGMGCACPESRHAGDPEHPFAIAPAYCTAGAQLLALCIETHGRGTKGGLVRHLNDCHQCQLADMMSD